ncbi:hypothetical protein BST45_10005 [Mycobacterium shinjukuense]|nr:hypothetical protein BST45_10005 [Mycobacterium shinjukuense]
MFGWTHEGDTAVLVYFTLSAHEVVAADLATSGQRDGLARFWPHQNRIPIRLTSATVGHRAPHS